MPDRKADMTVARQVELAIGQLDSLSTLPCTAAQLFSGLQQSHFSPSALADIIESDPALTAKILSLINKQSVILPDERISLRQGLDKLDADIVRDAFFSIKVFQAVERNDNATALRKQLLLHCLAVACCAKDIAEITLPQMDSQLAYCAGLLHDVGKFAIEDAMPKSFARIVEEAKSRRAGTCAIEQKHLGADHTILGKRLSQKWHLPDAIGLALWLHHSDTVTIYQNMSEGRIAAVVQLADSIARQSSIGQSGSFDSPVEIEPIADILGINLEQLQRIRQNLSEQVEEKSKVLGLDLPNAVARYANTAHGSAAQLARDNTKLSGENRQLQTASSHLDFITEFLLGINSAAGAIDIAESFATRWQKFYQTGMVCLYLAPSADLQTLEAVVVEKLSHSKIVSLSPPTGTAIIPKAIANSFAILDAYDYIDWLFEQLDVQFDVNRTKLVPLLSDGKAIGVIAFELHWPGDTKLFEEKFRTVTSVAGTVLDMAISRQREGRFAERFARLICVPAERGPSKPKQTQPQITTASSLNALAEMAAGAAHELNNPLSVISGRAQLLAGAETEKEKKKILKQIQDNAREASAIIEDLMSFAEPPAPRPTRTDIKQIIDEAIQLTSQKTKVEHINAQIKVGEDVKTVFVDSGQVVSAIASIISNAIESYRGKAGAIKIAAELGRSDLIKLAVSDLGCGMDAETIQKATHPFFSVRQAGRKRGMGLAFAARFIQLNGGSLQITSQPGEGTTVTILLPQFKTQD